MGMDYLVNLGLVINIVFIMVKKLIYIYCGVLKLLKVE